MVLKIGHRGACGHALENTALSVEKALELGVDMIEIDVRVCRTGEIVLLHDSSFKKLFNAKGLVSRKAFDEIKKLYTNDGNNINTLNDILNLVDRKALINIDLKRTKAADPVAETIRNFVENQKWSYEDFLVSSFNKRALKKFHELCPKVKIGWIFYIDDFKPKIQFMPDFSAKNLPLYSLHPNFKLVDKEFVDEAHRKELKVFVWTVNDKEDIARMISYGVDGIISDYPERIK
ncbi:glycerophosphodiester phosphodiesterase [Candidatus Pacearchaeota archaeon]|nr:glycerophosphodiester phosphodiesterase [Candidatus Pacearchaeota archaeon]